MRLARVDLWEEERAWAGSNLLGTPTRRTWRVVLTTDTGREASGEVAWLARAGGAPDVLGCVGAWALGWLGRDLPPADQAPGLPASVAWAITAALADLHDDWEEPEVVDENGLLAAEGPAVEVARRWSAHMAANRQIQTWKIKVGRGSFEEDLERLRALEIPEGVRLRLDPNRVWGHLDPGEVATALHGLPLDYLEEPAPWPTLASWSGAGLPVAADESVLDVDIATLADAGVRAVVLKPSVLGGLGEVLSMLDEAGSHGLKAVISSSLEGPVGRRHLACLVSRLRPPRPAAGLARDALHDAPVRTERVGTWSHVDDPLVRAAAHFPDAVALDTPDGGLTFADWDRAASERAAELGDRTGERLIVEITGAEGAVALMATLRAGAIACLVPPGVQRDAAIAQVGATSIGPGSGVPPGIDLGRPATLVWSSGSQGRPRAIAHSLGQHLSSAAASHLHIPFAVGDRWLAALRMHHVGGLALLFRALFAGGTVVFPRERPLDALAPTHMSWVPTQLLRASGPPPATLRHLLLGGAAAPPDLVRSRRVAGWPVHTTYGSTETASQACTSDVDGDPQGSGRALVGRVVRATPRIRIRGTTVCLGIWGEQGVRSVTDEAGWLRTGDVGEIAADGTLRVHGRADTMFISGGENVFPEAIERVLGALDGVHAVVVVGVPDPVWGARPWAFVDGSLSLQGAIAACRQRLPRAAWVDRILPWEEEGVGATGKPRRGWFAARALEILEDGAGG